MQGSSYGSQLEVVVYTHDNSLFDLLRGLVGIQGSVLLAEEGDFVNSHLGCIIVDFAYTNRNLILDALADTDDNVIVVVSANPFVISQLGCYNIDAILSKPLNGESVQAVLVGARARLAQKVVYG